MSDADAIFLCSLAAVLVSWCIVLVQDAWPWLRWRLVLKRLEWPRPASPEPKKGGER